MYENQSPMTNVSHKLILLIWQLNKALKSYLHLNFEIKNNKS